MNDTWMSRYAGVTMALIHHTNVVSRTMSFKIDHGDGILLSHQQTQILDLIIVYGDRNLTITEYARILGLSKSMVSQSAKDLQNKGLVERYRLGDNRKSVILRPTEKGIKVFNNYIASNTSHLFEKFFSKLSELSDEQLKIVEDAIYALDAELEEDTEIILTPVEN